MISANNKKKIEEKMKGVTVVRSSKQKFAKPMNKTRNAASSDSVKKKFTQDKNENTDNLVKKFLPDSKSNFLKSKNIKNSDSIENIPREESENREDEQIEVGKIRSKRKRSDDNVSPERTIIISKKGNILGSQG